MSGKSLRTEAQFTSFSSRADGSLRVSLVTPELSAEEKVAFMSLQNLLVEILVYPKEEKDPEVVEVRKGLECKTPSQRLREVLFILFKQEKIDDSFESFYEKKMEQLISFVKGKLHDNIRN